MLENEWGEVYALLIHPPLHDLINYFLIWREMKPHNHKKSNLAVSWWHSNENKHIIHSGQYCAIVCKRNYRDGPRTNRKDGQN